MTDIKGSIFISKRLRKKGINPKGRRRKERRVRVEIYELDNQCPRS